MTRFQLLFRTSVGERYEMRDNSDDGEPKIGGVVVLDGMIFAHGRAHWLATREDTDGMIRFICTPANGPTRESQDHVSPLALTGNPDA